MSTPARPAPRVRFGPYEADLRSGELRKHGIRIKLQIQPFQILAMFLERPNELITREELQKRIWPQDTFVDFDHGLNKAVNKLRDALNDSSGAPRYIETVPRRGYRFIAEVERVAPEAAQTGTDEAGPAPAKLARWRWPVVVAVTVGIVLAIVAGTVRHMKSRGAAEQVSGSLAVLPLIENDNAGADYELADGITDGIIDDLSLTPNLRVISHASVFQYRGRSVDPRSVGQSLGVASVLTGRLKRNAEDLTLDLELTATADGRRLWGQQFVRPIGERSAMQHDVASAVADALRFRQDRARLVKAEINPEAQQLYFKARYYFFRETPEDVLRARGLLQEAIDKEPTYSLAYAAIGDSYDWMASEGFQPAREVMAQARAAKRKAAELDDESAEVHSSLAALEFCEWNWAKADLEFQRAMQLNPNYFEGHRLYSIYLRSMRRFPEAIKHATAAERLNPLLLPAKSHLALTYFYAREYAVSAEQYRSILKDDPTFAAAHLGLASVYARMGTEKEAIAEWQTALTQIGDPKMATRLGDTFARKGFSAARAEILRSEIADFGAVARKEYVSPLEFASRYALLNDKDQAFTWLEKAYAERSPQLFNLNVDPDYDAIRGDPRFKQLVSRLGLPE
jgi:TolB-like protein/DNA-binding winged helix-turn-helix (wHTH) protein